MKEFNDARREYEQTPIPPELGARVQAGIRQGQARRRRRTLRTWGLSAAACFAVLAGVLNVSPQAAAAAARVPVLGGLFQVLTVRDYETSQDGINYDVSVPEVDAGGSETTQLVNEMIQAKVDEHLAKARQDWADYRDAFFATGGTQEEWGGREMDVIIDYEVTYQSGTRVSFVVTFAEGWVASMEERYCYNLDLAEDREITLAEILGENWVERCNTAIREQIEARKDEDGFSFFFEPEMGGFTTVDEDTAFYLNEDGTPVVVFPEYSIAAGAAGSPEFPIAYSQNT